MTSTIENSRTAILTQFNLEPPSHWNVPNRSLEQNWLEERLDLMEITSLPSLRGQTVKDFIWVIFVHPISPPCLRARLGETAVDCFERRLVEVEGFNDVPYGVILESVIPGDSWLSVKLDSENLLARKFVEAANQRVETGDYCLDDGAYLEVTSMTAFKRHYPNNSFSFQVSERGSYVLDEDHQVIKDDCPVRTKHPMWRRFHHGENVSPDWYLIRMFARLTVRGGFEILESEKAFDPRLTWLGRVLETAESNSGRFLAFLIIQRARVQRKLKRKKSDDLR